MKLRKFKKVFVTETNTQPTGQPIIAESPGEATTQPATEITNLPVSNQSTDSTLETVLPVCNTLFSDSGGAFGISIFFLFLALKRH